MVFNLSSYSGGGGCWGYIIDVAGARISSDSFDGIAAWYDSPWSESTWHTNAVTTTVANDLLLSFVDGPTGNSSTPTGWSTGPGEATAGTGTYYYQMLAPTGNSYSVPNTSYSVAGFFGTDVIAIAPQGAAAPPTMTSVVPNSGTQGLQVGVTLTGTNFLAGATVAVSGTGVAAGSVSVLSATQITATLTIDAAATTGQRNVSVTTSAGTSNTVAFTVNAAAAPPTLTSVAPSSGTQGLQVGVTLTGTNFLSGATVAVSGTGVTAGVTGVTATQISATLTIDAAATTGQRNISVTTSAGTSNTVAFTVNAASGQATNVFPSSGNVGIGTTNPGYKLDVQGGQINSSGGYCINGTNCITSWPTGGGGSGTVTSVTAGSGLSGGIITTSGTMSLNLANANAWTGAQSFGANTSFPGGIWNSSGGVGIGTAAPSTSLQIGNSISYTQDARITMAAASGSGQLRSWSVGTKYGGTTTSSPNYGLTIRDESAGVERMVIDWATGNVGIGTTNPQHLLHVAGTVGAQEVIVSSTGADYVFDPGYHLAPLSEVAGYINEHHHLPDVPSAAEIQQKGASVGEMQAKLLAKIEELTLHMIQAEERGNRLEQQNRDLQERISRLESKSSRAAGN